MKIVCGVDGSDPSIRALGRAVEIATERDAELHVLTVVHLSGFYYSALAGALIDEADLEETIADAVWESVTPVLAEHPVIKIQRKGYAPSELVRYAEEIEAELIVVGNRGFGPVRSAILGSTSHYIAQHAPCEVLIVPTRADEV